MDTRIIRNTDFNIYAVQQDTHVLLDTSISYFVTAGRVE